jgi:hypothetical protein
LSNNLTLLYDKKFPLSIDFPGFGAKVVPSQPTSEKIGRYQAWLDREFLERPLVGLLWEPDIPPLPDFLEQVGVGSTLVPDDIHPEIFLPAIESWYQRDQELPGDVIQPFTPAFGIPWVEAIAGCPVVGHPGSFWAQPCLDNYADRAPIRFDPQNPWLCKLIEFTKALVEFSRGRFAIALPQMRGPLDTLAAMRTPEQMGLDLIEQPEQARKILSELTDLWIGIAETILAVIPPFYGGYCSRMKMWAPGRTITPQNDISTLLSPKMYRNFVLPLDQRIVEHFPYHCFHAHGSEYRQVDNWLRLQNLTAIQFTLEHTLGGPSLDISLSVVRRILETKPVILAALDVETAERCVNELPAVGLCVTLATNSAEIPEEYVRWITAHCA